MSISVKYETRNILGKNGIKYFRLINEVFDLTVKISKLDLTEPKHGCLWKKWFGE